MKYSKFIRLLYFLFRNFEKIKNYNLNFIFEFKKSL